MAGNYEIWLTDDKGLRLADSRGRTLLDNILHLRCSRVTGRIGGFNLRLPATFDTHLVTRPDRMVQVWRAPEGGRLKLWRVYFIRRWRFSTQGTEEQLYIEGPDVNDLLRRRIIAAYASSTQAEKTDFADDMMKEIITEAIADGVAPTPDAGTRVWSDLSIAADLSNGPPLTKAFAFKRLLTHSGAGVLADIAKASREAGTEVFFDIVPHVVTSSSINFIFRTFTGQPGQDVTDRVVFDQQRGNLQNPVLEYDYSDEVNYVYGGGQGENDQRNIQQAYDTTRYLASQWNRCEGFADARNQETDDGVREAARAELEEGRPRRIFQGIPVDTAGTRFGIDWGYGYKVRARYRGEEFDAIIRGVMLTVQEGEEQINTKLEYEG